jgi:hypothetical protein
MILQHYYTKWGIKDSNAFKDITENLLIRSWTRCQPHNYVLLALSLPKSPYKNMQIVHKLASEIIKCGILQELDGRSIHILLKSFQKMQFGNNNKLEIMKLVSDLVDDIIPSAKKIEVNCEETVDINTSNFNGNEIIMVDQSAKLQSNCLEQLVFEKVRSEDQIVQNLQYRQSDAEEDSHLSSIFSSEEEDSHLACDSSDVVSVFSREEEVGLLKISTFDILILESIDFTLDPFEDQPDYTADTPGNLSHAVADLFSSSEEEIQFLKRSTIDILNHWNHSDKIQ